MRHAEKDRLKTHGRTFLPVGRGYAVNEDSSVIGIGRAGRWVAGALATSLAISCLSGIAAPR